MKTFKTSLVIAVLGTLFCILAFAVNDKSMLFSLKNGLAMGCGSGLIFFALIKIFVSEKSFVAFAHDLKILTKRS